MGGGRPWPSPGQKKKKKKILKNHTNASNLKSNSILKSSDLTTLLIMLFIHTCLILKECDTLPLIYTGTWKIQGR